MLQFTKYHVIIQMSVKSDKARFLNGVITGGYAPLHNTGTSAEFMKGGVLMKSKHCIYGKKAICSIFCSYRFVDNFFHKSRITASAKTVIR